SFIVAILLTSLSYFLGNLIIIKGIFMWEALVIGTTVVTVGALTEALGAPIWLIVIMPFPVGMTLLFLFLKQPLHIWFLT
ncbi:hypothetical protein SB759_39800, partial [Pseudomonas sp. SIMBA_059]